MRRTCRCSPFGVQSSQGTGEIQSPRDEHDGVVTNQLVGKSIGAESMSLGISTTPAGYGGDTVYPDHDEIVYIASGTVEVTIDGKTQVLGQGKTLFVPKGEPYGYKVVEGPNQVFYAFAPARS